MYQKFINPSHTEHEYTNERSTRPGVGSSLVFNIHVSTEEGWARERGPGGGNGGECRLGTGLLHSLAESAQSLPFASLPARRFLPAGCRSWVPGSSSCMYTEPAQSLPCDLWNQSPASLAPLSCSRIICPWAALVKLSQRWNQITRHQYMQRCIVCACRERYPQDKHAYHAYIP